VEFRAEQGSDGKPTVQSDGRHRYRIYAVLAWLVLSCLLPGMIAACVLFMRNYAEGRAQLEKTTIATARALSQAVDSQLLKGMAAAQVLSTAGALTRQDWAAFHERADNVLALSKAGDIVVLSDATGQQIVNTLRKVGEPLPRHGNMAVLERVFATGKPVISDIYLGGALRKPLMSIDVPIMQDGKVAYDVSLGMLPERFNNILLAQNLPSGWVAGVIDSTGTLAGRLPSPEKFIGQKGTAEFIQRIKDVPEGVMETVSREGIPTLSAWSRSPVTGWSVGIGIPREELEATLRNSQLALGLGFVLLLLLGLVLAWLAARRIGGAVRALTAPATALGAGKRVVAPLPDIVEAAEVAEAIGRASELLAERTADLEQANKSLSVRDAELREAHRLARFGAWRWSIETGAMSVSESVHTIFGCELPPFEQLRGGLLPVESWETMHTAIQDVIRTGIGCSAEIQANHDSGYPIWLDLRCGPIHGADGTIIGVAGTMLDITQRKEAELALQRTRENYVQQLEEDVARRTIELTSANEALDRLARTDALTGLANRTVSDENLHMEFLRLKRTGSTYAVLFMDIDYFKSINDTHGHAAGDQVLQQLARLLAESTRETDLVARYGGEEFLAVLTDTDVDSAMAVAEKIRQTVAQEAFPNVGHVTLSVGVTLARLADDNEDAAVRRADEALYEAKRTGRNTVCFC